MKKIAFVVAVVIASIGMISCARQSNLMQPVATMNETVNPNEAVIVFYRPVPINFLVSLQTPVIEASKAGKLNFVGIISPNTKYFHRTKPGKHIYYLGTATNIGSNLVGIPIMEANLEAGKIYYASIWSFSGSLGLAPSSGFVPSDSNKRMAFPEFFICRII